MTNKSLIVMVWLLFVTSSANCISFYKFGAGIYTVGLTASLLININKYRNSKTLSDGKKLNSDCDYEKLHVDISGLSKKEVILALLQKSNLQSVSISKDKLPDKISFDANSNDDRNRIWVDYYQGSAIKVHETSENSLYIAGFDYNNGEGLAREAIKELTPVADKTDFKKCSRRAWQKQYNVEDYQAPEGRIKIARYYDEGRDLCRGMQNFPRYLSIWADF